MKKNVLLIIFLFLLFPHVTFAFTSLNASTPNPVVGEEFYVQFNIDYLGVDGTDPEINDFNACVLFDDSYFTFTGYSWTASAATLDTSEPGKICLNKEKTYTNWSAKVSPLVLKFKALKSGLTEIRVTHNGTESHYGNGDPIAQSFSGIKVNPVVPSSDTTIGSLGVKGYTIHPTFSKTYYDYYLTVDPDVSSVFVDAKPMNNKQTISGAGTIQLKYGLNIVHVIVKAQDGSTREYKINITRTDNRTGDTSLRSLNVSDTTIKYEEGKTEYSAIVSRSVDSVMIDARPNDSNATLVGTGRRKLEMGENVFELTLQTSKNDTPIEKKYIVKITRSNEELEKVVQSSKLKSLSINNLNTDISNDKKVFYTGIFDEKTSIAIDAKTESQTADVTIEGNENLKAGLNEIKLTVTENNDEKTEYKIVVYKNPRGASINSLNYINETNNHMIYNTDDKSTDKLSTTQLRYLKNNTYRLYYNAVTLNNALVYQILVDNPPVDEDIELSFVKQEDKTPTYKTNLKEGYEIMVFVGDVYKDDQPVKVYTYNEKGKYKLLTDGVKVQSGYINFKTNGDEYYVLTTASLIANVGPVTAFFNQYKTLLIGGAIALVVIYIIIKFVKKQNAIKRKNEPLY
jgi:hypothetical protein